MIQKYRNLIRIIIPIILLILVLLTIWRLFSSNAELKKSAETFKNNARAYEGLYNRELSNNNILQLSELELKMSNDSLTREIGKFIAKNKKDKKLEVPTTSGGVSQEINIPINIVDTLFKFPEYNKVECLNKETCLTINLKDSTLSIDAKITNSMLFEFGYNRVYLNDYKNGWVRFWNFDWKKVNSYEYVLSNSNELIENKDVKIININER